MPAGSETVDHEMVKGSWRLPPLAGATAAGASGTAASCPSKPATSALVRANANNNRLVMRRKREQGGSQRIVWTTDAHDQHSHPRLFFTSCKTRIRLSEMRLRPSRTARILVGL